MNSEKCISGKNKYESEKDAQKAAELGMHLRKISYLSTYFCLLCHNWHLTSSKRNKK